MYSLLNTFFVEAENRLDMVDSLCFCAKLMATHGDPQNSHARLANQYGFSKS